MYSSFLYEANECTVKITLVGLHWRIPVAVLQLHLGALLGWEAEPRAGLLQGLSVTDHYQGEASKPTQMLKVGTCSSGSF